LLTYAARQFLQLVPTILLIAVLAFFILRVAPGDPTALLLPQDASADDIARLRATLGLDRPLIVQFATWFVSLLRGDLGTSFYTRGPVVDVIASRIVPTVWLAAAAQLVAILIAIPLGVLAALRQNGALDRGVTVLALAGVAIPNFWLGMLLVLLVSVELRWLPSQGFVDPLVDPVEGLRRLILPAITLGFAQAALITRMTRSAMLDVIRLDYIRTARAKGLHERVVILHHALRNAMAPIVTVVGLSVASLLGGAIVTELVFNFPGLGQLIVEAVRRRDFPLIQGVLVLLAMVTVLVNYVVDLSYGYIDPRIRYE
jgi:peptide/nickel transport system permease protein